MNFENARNNSPKSFFINTYGCQMNSRDSENMTALLKQSGFLRSNAQNEADIIIFNTCCVRGSAEDKFFGHLSRLKPVKTKNPSLIIAVSGCMSQQEEVKELIENKYPYVDIVIGTGNRHLLPEYIKDVAKIGKKTYDIAGMDNMPANNDFDKTIRDEPHKAGINIMYGCDNFCSYCIVPYVRGRERSRPPNDICNEADLLARDGVKEIMLLGQNVNAYGKHQSEKNFPELIRSLSDINGLKRIRFMTSHPRDFSDELIFAIRDLPKMCKHVHLPLQAGSTKVLADMNRGYTKENYLALVSKIKTEITNVAITTDIIVGYPGETDEDFLDTLDVASKAEFAGAFTFIYSKRSGTPAANRKDTVADKIKSRRFEELTNNLYPTFLRFNQRKLGHVFEVMVEENKGGGNYKGRTDDHSLVNFFASKTLEPGEIVPVKITEAKTFYVLGEAYD